MSVMLERWNDDKMDVLAGRVDDLEWKARRSADAEDRLERMEQRTSERFYRLYECLIQANVVAIIVLLCVLIAIHR